MAEAGEFLLVLCSLPDPGPARNLAEDVVQEGLAACVQVVPGIHSFFSWAGKPDRAEECLLLFKTTRKRYPALEEKILRLHPYELPEIIALPLAAGLGNYLSWIEKNTDMP